MVNVAEVICGESETDFQSLLAFIRSARGGRHFFNPLPAGISA